MTYRHATIKCFEQTDIVTSLDRGLAGRTLLTRLEGTGERSASTPIAPILLGENISVDFGCCTHLRLSLLLPRRMIHLLIFELEFTLRNKPLWELKNKARADATVRLVRPRKLLQ